MTTRSLLSSLLLAGALVSTGADAWYLDSSCAPYESFISDAMANAFNMAEYGRLGLSNIFQGHGTQQEKDLADNLFGPRDDAKYQRVEKRFEALHRVPLVNKQTSGFNVNNKADLNVVLFCDFSRMKNMTSQQQRDAASSNDGEQPTKYTQWDSVMQLPTDFSPKSDMYMCRNSKGNDDPPDAMTRATGMSSDTMYSYTQLCPWYLERLSKSPKKTLTDIKDFPAFAAGGQSISNNTRGFTPIGPGASASSQSQSSSSPSANLTLGVKIGARSGSGTGTGSTTPSPPLTTAMSTSDMARTAGATADLLDITLLHELTHSRASVLDPHTEEPTTDINGYGAGWQDTKDLALNASDTNAESLALYGWSCWLNAQGVSVEKNGTVIPWV